MSKRLIALLAATAALTVFAAGCGDGEDSTTATGGSPEDEITAIVEESVLFEDPATVCEENFTERALEDNYEGDDREALLADCGDDEEGNVADLEVSSVEVDGDTAVAEVSARDEDEDEALDFTVALVDDGGWKIDGVK